MRSPSESVETVIAGAGPAGLFLAAELHRRGRQCVLVERSLEPSTRSKALAIMPGTMEMFELAGIAARFSTAANRVDGVRFVTPRRCAYVPFRDIESAYNYVSILPQWKTQALLAQRLGELGGEVRYGWTLVALRQRAEGVEVDLETPNGPRTLRARYVVGCDGVNSTVRELAGIQWRGGSYPGTALLADTPVRTSIPVKEARVHVHCGGVVTMFPMSDSVRRIVVIAPREVLPETASREWLEKRLRAAGYGETEIEEPVWSNAFRVHRRIASAMRCGNVFLAGDSVHTHSPVGGQGMNIGLHDAWNLAEKLAAVLAGDARESLLDRYQRERLPAARAVLRRTHVLTRALAHPHPFMRVARERIAPAIAGLPVVYGPMIRRLSLTA
ncbi:MAG TPA: FAD-dependent monooxygenase [Candidatus Baltobacteraceae bacterium]|nr:FAD-dependent monooxygenase [Candidatus Baltobacteraceae bacterium]